MAYEIPAPNSRVFLSDTLTPLLVKRKATPPFKFVGLTHPDMEDVYKIQDSKGQFLNIQRGLIAVPKRSVGTGN